MYVDVTLAWFWSPYRVMYTQYYRALLHLCQSLYFYIPLQKTYHVSKKRTVLISI